MSVKEEMFVKASAQSLCNNILMRARRDKVSVTPMKLQKILYYVCVKYVQETGVYPLLERFEVWKYGPVISSVYSKFKLFGVSSINKYARDAKGEIKMVDEDANPTLRGCLDFVWEKYKDFSGSAIAQRTQMEGTGWYAAYQRQDEIIRMEDMRNDRTV